MTIPTIALTLLATDAGTSAGVTAIVVQLLKDGIIAPRTPSGPARDALLRSLNYLINFVLLLTFIATEGYFDWSQLVVYVGLAFGQSVATQVVYKTVGSNGSSGSTTS